MKKQQSVISKISNKTPAKKKTIVNNIEIVFDASGSMGVIRQKALDAVNQQIEAIRTNSLNSGQVVNLGITFFNGLGSNRMSFDASNIRTINFSEYIPDGGTPLWDAVGRAMDQAPSANRNEDTSYMVIVVTDGEENESRTYNQ
jgi:Mg-chelatase subunit ChlD